MMSANISDREICFIWSAAMTAASKLQQNL